MQNNYDLLSGVLFKDSEPKRSYYHQVKLSEIIISFFSK